MELCEKYSINPMEFDDIPDEVKMSMLAKRQLEIEARQRVREEQEKNNK